MSNDSIDNSDFFKKLTAIYNDFEAQQDINGITLYSHNGELLPDHLGLFNTGEELVIKGYVFKVGYVGNGAILLEPIKYWEPKINK